MFFCAFKGFLGALFMDPGTLGNASNHFMPSSAPRKRQALRQPWPVLDKQAVRHAGRQVGGQRPGSCPCSCPWCAHDRGRVCGIGYVRARVHAGKQAGSQAGKQAFKQAGRRAKATLVSMLVFMPCS